MVKEKIELPNSYDVVGSIAILKFDDEKLKEKKKIAEKLIKERNNIETVFEKKDKIKGRLRTLDLRHLAGKKTTKTLHIESGCKMRVDIDKCYFSPRMSNDRIEIAEKIKKKDSVLVMFSGLSPYPLVIEKLAKPKEIVAVEIGRECSKLAEENVKMNKMEKKIEVIQGDVKRIIPRLAEKKRKFDKIVMARPNLKNTFLKQAFMVCKKNTIIFFHGFGKDVEKILNKIEKDAKKYNKKIKILDIQKIGNIAPYTFRWRVELRIK